MRLKQQEFFVHDEKASNSDGDQVLFYFIVMLIFILNICIKQINLNYLLILRP